ncbi:MtaA/CmuA family methyltransferase [Methanosalsum natronophilum]|uniref:MtaA/CmuA family methyltransferase n=1 Tax=Methanosalsum natronophilum TaxID=768733 RepID=A0A3R7VRZ8_9EURY|nr:MAG: MtaA/CmuA family methyltransferase [Methanosalsum natronophilum]
MAFMTIRERFLDCLIGSDVDKIPVCSVTQTGTVELMEATGSYWPEAHYNPEKMATLAIGAHKIVGLEGVRYPFDGTDIGQALGCEIKNGTLDSQPSIYKSPCQTKEDALNFSISENILDTERLSTLLDATKIIRGRVGEDVPIIAGMVGPAAIATCIVGVTNYLMWCITNPEIIKHLLKIGTDICIDYSNALFEHGADAICIPDSESGPDLLPPSCFETLFLPLYKKISSNTTGPMILHMCGDATDILDSMAITGFEGLSIEEKVNTKYANDVIGKRACLIGNVAPVDILLSSQPSDVIKDAQRCMDDGVNILAPGCGLAPHTPTKNLKALVYARNEYYKN